MAQPATLLFLALVAVIEAAALRIGRVRSAHPADRTTGGHSRCGCATHDKTLRGRHGGSSRDSTTSCDPSRRSGLRRGERASGDWTRRADSHDRTNDNGSCRDECNACCCSRY